MKIQIFKDKKGEWRWTMTARNGRKLATSGEGYKNKSHCTRMAKKLFECFEWVPK